MTPITGKELLAQAKALTAQDQSKSMIAKSCGYVRVIQRGDRAGTEIPDIAGLSAALLDAQGFEFGGGRNSSPRGVIRKTRANLLIVGDSYHGDVKPGTAYRVVPNDDGTILLEPEEEEAVAA